MSTLNEYEIDKRLGDYLGWSYFENQLEKIYKFRDFASAMKFVNDVAKEAEEMNHHPDIFIHSYNKVKISLSTHSEGGVTDKDFNLAKKIEDLI